MNVAAQSQPYDEKARLRKLAGIADRCRRDRWYVDHDDGGTHVLTQRADGQRDILCTIYPAATTDEAELISAALENLVLFLTLRKRSIAAFAELEAKIGRPQNLRRGNFAANAAILLNDPTFHRFLERKTTGGAIHNADQADAAFKRLLRITSKKQLNTEEGPQTGFLRLRDDYENWKDRGRK